MSSSIFRKLLISCMSVLLIGMTLLAVIINFVLQDWLIRQKETVLYVQADNVIAQLDAAHRDSSFISRFDSLATEFKRMYGTKIDLLLPEEGLQKPKTAKQLLRKSELKDPILLEKVFNGERVHRTGPFKKTDNQVLLSVGVPILDGSHVVGALFLHLPVQEIASTEVTKLIMLVAFIFTLPAAAVLYWISRRISQPLIRMNQAAESIGSGRFSERIPVHGSDEVGQLSATFNRMAEQLQKLELMRKELIANVSHELRTPLTSVRGFVQGMLEGLVPPGQQKRYLEFIYAELHRLSTLLNTMLDLSAIESGQIQLQPRIIRWVTLVDTVADCVLLRAEEKHISLETFVEPEEEQGKLRVYGDPERLKQVLFNLLDNAIRHTPEGGSITIKSRPMGDMVEVRITDNGTGIDPEKLPYIWERFYTEENSRISRRERSGLGLTITKQLVEMMGGSIEVASTPGEGTTFVIRLHSHSDGGNM